MFHSTRGKDLISSKEALIKGLASDKGLYVTDDIKKLDLQQSDVNLSYKDLAFKIFKLYFDDFTDKELDEVVNLYNEKTFPFKEIKVRGTTDYAFLELYKGPTLSFKDMALTVLPKLIEIAKKDLNDKRRTVVLTATCGDTGSAALSGFNNTLNNSTIVLYPNNKISEVQEKQILSYSSDKNHIFAVNGTFDDCQKIVKDLFNEFKDKNIDLISANSINIGRIIPQIVYYFKAYLELVDKDYILFNEKINIVVPSGNFGNFYSALLAKKMGLPVNKIICATNENNGLCEFFKTGVYDSNRVFKQTLTPGMDILNSSNLERVVYYLYEDCDKVKELMNEFSKTGKFKVDLDLLKKKFDFVLAGSATDKETLLNIKLSYSNKILIDPHTAVAFKVYKEFYNDLNNCFTLISSIDSPYKFSDTICKALSIDNCKDDKERIEAIYSKTGVKIDNRLYNSLFKNPNITVYEKEEVKKKIIELINS